MEAVLPAPGVRKDGGGYLLLRLVRQGETLSGAVVAYASAQRLEHLLPFKASLRRVPP